MLTGNRGLREAIESVRARAADALAEMSLADVLPKTPAGPDEPGERAPD